MHLPLLQDMLIIIGFSVLIVFLLQRIKLPSILGFLITGVIIGPYGLSLVKAVEQVEIISEIGVILLLFVIGLELSIKQLASIKKTVFIGGFIQVGLTVIVSGLIYYLIGSPWNEALFVGFLFSLSSTAIVLKVFQDRNEITTAHGRNALGILIFQDIIVVPMMLFTPIIAGVSTNIGLSIISLLIKSAIVVLITFVSARYIVPKLMYSVAKTKNKELFLLTTIAICFAVAFLTSEAGLSLALGAFLAGLIISESEYSHQATSIILPFRELFTSFFFISIGMLLDLSFFLEHIGIISLIVFAVFVFKSLITAFAVSVLGHPPRTILVTGLALFQVGEFAFILSKVGIQYNLLDELTNQYFLAVSIVSMMLTPFVIMLSENIAVKFLGLTLIQKIPFNYPFTKKVDNGVVENDGNENHLVIIGYGINGSNLAKAAEYSNIPYVVLELNAEIVKKEQENGVPILFGDATHEHMLNAVNIADARAVVIAISDVTATKTIVSEIREISQSVYILVRTRYVKEINELIALGADVVIPEEFETSIQIFSRVLHNFLIPESDIMAFIQKIRSDNYGILQSQERPPKTYRPTNFPDFNITCVNVSTDSGKFLGKTLNQLDIRNKYGINILGISRDGEMLKQIDAEDVILQNDILFINGKQSDIDKFHRLLN